MDSQDYRDPELPVGSLQGLPGCRGRGHGGGMRPLRQTEGEGHGSPFPGCHDDGRVGRRWAGIGPWGTVQQSGRPCPKVALGSEYSPIRSHSQDLDRNCDMVLIPKTWAA